MILSLALLLSSLSPASTGILEDPEIPRLAEVHLESLAWRSLGPAAMGGRVTDLAVHPERARVFYVASATGGLFRTTNGGTTFAPVFDSHGSSSVGAVALAPSNPDVVWVGTGEANARNSVSWGDGVYRSDDGGETWTHRGLAETRHVGGIAIHPTRPELVFVAAMGRTWGRNAERGLYRTLDGGESWEQVLFVDDQTGCIDVRIDPEKPEVVYAATYQRQRDEFDSNDPALQTGPGSGLWRSQDGGTTWQRLGGGLPTTDMGRIGLDLFAGDSRVVYAIVETALTGERGAPPRDEDRVSLGIRGRDAEAGGFEIESVTEGESAAQAGLRAGDVVVAIDGKPVAERADLVTALADFRPGDAADLVYVREGAEETASLELFGRLLRGRERSFAGSQGGQVANAQDEQGVEGHQSGGVFRSDDRGTTWTRVNSLNPRPFYYSQIRVDTVDDEQVWVLGIELHVSRDGGKSFRTIGRGVHPDHHAMWIDPRDPDRVLLGNDGGVYRTVDDGASWEHLDRIPMAQFYNVAVDTRSPYWVYGGLQDNGSWGAPSATRERGIPTSAWIKLNGGDGFQAEVDPNDPDRIYVESQNGMIVRIDRRTGDTLRLTRPGGNRALRFNWNTPFRLSPHNSSILYYAGDRVFRSIDAGESSQPISEELSRTDQGTATALAESPFVEGFLLVGTDDGALARTRDGGRTWEPLADRLPGVEQPLYVSDVEFSQHRRDLVWVTLDGHRSDVEAPLVFESRDGGDTWVGIANDLPGHGPVRTIAPDPVNPDLLFVGTEFGCYASVDGGGHWTRFGAGLPTVPVHELVVHPTEGDLVAATHGRGIWIADIAPLQDLNDDVLAGEPYLFPVEPARRWNSPPAPERSGDGHYLGANPPAGAAFYYYLPEDVEGDVRLVVRDAVGAELRELEGPATAGLHLVRWDLRARQGSRGRGAGGGGGFGGGGLAHGDYSVTLRVGDVEVVRRVRILPDPMDEMLEARPVR